MAKMSVFTYEDKIKHADFHQRVSIYVDGITVKGYLTSQFKITSNPEYEPLLTTGYGKFKLVETAMKLQGSPIFASTEFNNRYYKGGNYITFPIEFRVLDYDGDGLVRQYADKLIKHSLPNQLNVGELVKGTGKNIVNGVSEAVKGVTDLVTGKSTTDASIQGILEKGNKAFSKLQEKAGVGPVRATIGDMVEGKFLLTNIDVTYSEEYVKSKDGGIDPLYADISVTLETPSIPNKSGTGTGGDMRIITNSIKRVTEE